MLEQLLETVLRESYMLDPDDPKDPVVRTEMTKVGAAASDNTKWLIEPHSFDDNNTGMRLEFMHVDNQPVLQVYSNLRDKVARFLFDAGGKLMHSDIRPFPDPAMVSPVEPAQVAEASTDTDPVAVSEAYPTELAKAPNDYRE